VVQAHNHHCPVAARGILDLAFTLLLFLLTALLLTLAFLLQTFGLTVLTPAAVTAWFLFLPFTSAVTVTITIPVTVAVSLTTVSPPSVSLSVAISRCSLLRTIQELLNCVKIEVVGHFGCFYASLTSQSTTGQTPSPKKAGAL